MQQLFHKICSIFWKNALRAPLGTSGGLFMPPLSLFLINIHTLAPLLDQRQPARIAKVNCSLGKLTFSDLNFNFPLVKLTARMCGSYFSPRKVDIFVSKLQLSHRKIDIFNYLALLDISFALKKQCIL